MNHNELLRVSLLHPKHDKDKVQYISSLISPCPFSLTTLFSILTLSEPKTAIRVPPIPNFPPNPLPPLATLTIHTSNHERLRTSQTVRHRRHSNSPKTPTALRSSSPIRPSQPIPARYLSSRPGKTQGHPPKTAYPPPSSSPNPRNPNEHPASRYSRDSLSGHSAEHGDCAPGSKHCCFCGCDCSYYFTCNYNSYGASAICPTYIHEHEHEHDYFCARCCYQHRFC